MKTTAWVLYPNKWDRPVRERLVLESIELAPLEEDEALVRPLYGCWEGNMDHALTGKPIDVCRDRAEDKVVIGNSGVVRVLEVRSRRSGLEPGDLAILFCVGDADRFGYPRKIMAYDAPGTMGCQALEMKCKLSNLIPIPAKTRFSLAAWAAFSLRYVTAWSNWELAHGVLRLQVGREELPSPQVWGWGGGTTFAELTLARFFGCKSVMLSGSDLHLGIIERHGITALDRRKFGDLWFDEERYKSDPTYCESYRRIEESFLAEVRRRTNGEMVHIFADYIGGGVYRATLKALARQGVITTAGWKRGMTVWQLRAKECIDRHQHVSTHYARYDQGRAAVEFAEEHGWMPTVDERVWAFSEIPTLADAYRSGATGYFPCYEIARDS
jgi:NADPH:quinone reductase-like Zn-dependent oxidoreductase